VIDYDHLDKSMTCLERNSDFPRAEGFSCPSEQFLPSLNASLIGLVRDFPADFALFPQPSRDGVLGFKCTSEALQGEAFEDRVMGITLLIIAIVSVTLAAAYVVTTRSAVHPALAGQNTVVGLADPAAETLVGGTPARTRTDWQLTTVDDLTNAEDLLDCLEAQGYTDRELVVLGNSCFAVRWR
jgi:hypothetical protein